MFKLLDKYILKQFLYNFVFTIITFITIFILVDIIDHLDRFMDSDIPQIDIIRFYKNTIPWFISIALPMSVLLSTVLTLGLLEKNQEITAIKSSGISSKRISLPLLILGTLISLSSFYFENYIVTDNFQKRSELEDKYSLNRSNYKKNKKNNLLRQINPNEVLSIKRFLFRNNIAQNISFQTFENGNIIKRLDANNMKWDEKSKKWIINQYKLRLWNNNSLNYYSSGKDTIINLKLDPMDLTQQSVKPEEMNYWDLSKFVSKLKNYGINDPRWEVNLHFKPAFACTSFLMILFGLSLSNRKRQYSLAKSIGMSIIIIFLYYAAIKSGQTLGFKGIMNPMASVWTPNFIFFIVGGYYFLNNKY
tara:strand:+ start:1438 stop:2523 length:1086 start_codon:yes stop_codon:yes gene_type:complete